MGKKWTILHQDRYPTACPSSHPAVTYSYKAIPPSHHTNVLYCSSPHNTPKHYSCYELFFSLFFTHQQHRRPSRPSQNRPPHDTQIASVPSPPSTELTQALWLPRALFLPQPRAPSHPAARPRVQAARSHPARSPRRPTARVIRRRRAISAFHRILGRPELSRPR